MQVFGPFMNLAVCCWAIRVLCMSPVVVVQPFSVSPGKAEAGGSL